MKKTMLFAAALAGVMSISMMAGAESADDVLNQMIAASKEAKETTVTSQVFGAVNLNFPDMDMSMDLVADGNLDIAANTETTESIVNGGLSLNVFGQTISVDVSACAAKEDDGSLSAYAKAVVVQGDETSDSGWNKTTITPEQLDAIVEQINSMNISFSGLGFEITDEAAELDNGTTCYELTASLTVADLINFAKPYLAEAEAEIDDETLEQINAMTSGLVFNFVYYVDKETYLPQLAHFDMAGSDYTIIETLINSMGAFGEDADGNPIKFELTVEDLYSNMFFNYDTPVVVEIPAEALASAQEMAPEDAPSLLEMVQNG